MVIAFALMVHRTDDDRVCHEQASSLIKNGDEVSIVSAYGKDWKSMSQKTNWMRDQLITIHPDVIVCDSPHAVLVAHKVKKQLKNHVVRVVYDVTEWYPSKKNLRGGSLLARSVKFVMMVLASVYAGCITDSFLFGEYHKAVPFKSLFFWKKSLLLPYYAPREKVKRSPAKESLSNACVLYYSGNLTSEKGFGRLLHLANEVATDLADVQFVLKIVTSSSIDGSIGSMLPNLKIETERWMPFDQFCATVGEADIFIDLRDNDMENTRCMPIKIFYYMAAGRPVLYSNLKAIPIGLPEIDSVGVLVDPDDVEAQKKVICKYIQDPELYQSHCRNALRLVDEKYNWEMIEESFVKYIHDGV